MNRRALYYALVYSALVIAFKLFIVLGGYSLTNFGFFYSHIVSVFFVIPFYVLAIKGERDNEKGGIIGGREAMRIALTIFAISAIITSVYNYIEFETWGRAMAEEYYRSEKFTEFLNKQNNVKPERYPQIVQEQLDAIDGFKATTGKLFSFLIVGLSSAFICAALMKRNVRRD